jgi:hypothetical protein
VLLAHQGGGVVKRGVGVDADNFTGTEMGQVHG